MKKLLVLFLVIMVAFISCKSQSETDYLKQKLNEKLDSLELCKEQIDQYKDSLLQERTKYCFDPFDSQLYDTEFNISNSANEYYDFKQRNDSVWVVISTDKGMSMLYQWGSDVKLYVSPPVVTTSNTYKVESINFNWFK